MGALAPKQFLQLGGKALMTHALAVLNESSVISGIIVAVPADQVERCWEELVIRQGFTKVTTVVPGGAQRQDSVRLGLAEVGHEVDLVLVHDAVRPFITEDMVERVVARASEVGAAVVAIPMKDTVKLVGEAGLVDRTIDRGALWLAQTPQAFHAARLKEVHHRAVAENFYGTDDAQLLEHFGYHVGIVEGRAENIKLTRPEDFTIGEAMLATRQGQGR